MGAEVFAVGVARQRRLRGAPRRRRRGARARLLEQLRLVAQKIGQVRRQAVAQRVLLVPGSAKQ